MFLVANLVTTSKAPVTTSVALVPNSFLLLNKKEKRTLVTASRSSQEALGRITPAVLAIVGSCRKSWDVVMSSGADDQTTKRTSRPPNPNVLFSSISLLGTSASLLGARTLLKAPGRTTRNKDATRNKVQS